MKIVAVAAYSGDPPTELVAKATKFINTLASKCGENIVLAFGGYWGLMKVMVDEAIKLGMKVLIFPPIEREEWVFPGEAIVVKTGTGFRLRSVALVRTGDVLVAMGGGAGTIQEIVTAYAEGKDIFLLTPTGLASDRIASLAPYIDERRLARLKIFSDPVQMGEEVCRCLCKGSKP